ncbi:hypothetical protein B0J17DRAFT_686349 [Rhizoctonia solani]|nr:hypothetical protein B0J17DRAFT_686349 [Rhizoctonia solani]
MPHVHNWCDRVGESVTVGGTSNCRACKLRLGEGPYIRKLRRNASAVLLLGGDDFTVP